MRKSARLGWGGPRKGAGQPAGMPTKVVRLPLAIAELVHGVGNGRFRPGVIAEAMTVEARTAAAVPLMSSRAACGFPSPADDHLERAVDFNELLGASLPSVFAVIVTGESMTGAGIFPGDVAVIDRAKRPKSGSIVLALIDGEFTIKRYCKKRGGQLVLQAENAKFSDILIEENTEFEVWGVVTDSIRRHGG